MRARLPARLAVLLCAALAVSGCGSSTNSTTGPTKISATASSASSSTMPARAPTSAGPSASGTPIGTSQAKASAPYHGATVRRRLRGVRGRPVTIALIRRLPRQHRPLVGAHLQGLQGSLTDKLTIAANSVAGNWARLFAHAGGSLPAASVALIGDQPGSCGSTPITSGSSPEYCPPTDTVQIPLGFVNTNVAPLGDAALLLLVSDLYGYHVENVLGMLGGGRSTAQLERVDACFSGVYFLTVYGSLEQRDEQSVTKLLALSAGGGVSGDELTTAFNVGLVVSGGDYRACLKAGV